MQNIIFDLDDTLIYTERLYHAAQDEMAGLLCPMFAGLTKDALLERYNALDIANITRYGLDKERMPQSKVDLYKELCREHGQTPNEIVIRALYGLGYKVYASLAELIPGAVDLLYDLSRDLNLYLYTSGDEDVQNLRLDRSGLRRYFIDVRITPFKTVGAMASLLSDYHLSLDDTVMIGNSLKSDILPAVSNGVAAILVTGSQWSFHAVDDAVLEPYRDLFVSVSDLAAIPLAIGILSARHREGAIMTGSPDEQSVA